MQLYFSDIACGTEFYMRHTELCIVEMQNLDLLLMNCSYYQTHYPNKYFNKYQVKVWYEESLSDEMSIVKNGISQLQLGNTIYFPDRIYTIGILSHYPLIIENLDITSGKELAMLFIGCIPFLNSSFDYVVVMLNLRCQMLFRCLEGRHDYNNLLRCSYFAIVPQCRQSGKRR